MYNLDEINEELQSFEEQLEYSSLSIPMKLNYVALYRRLLEAEQLPESELIKRAKTIKPLVRLDENGNRRETGGAEAGDKLVFIRPEDIRQSYLYDFNEDSIVTEERRDDEVVPLEAQELVYEITSFTCYHHYGGYYGFFRPGVDEVLSQIPPSVNLEEVHAFEIRVDSLNVADVYDGVLDRHVTTVILYGMNEGLPAAIAKQEVICDEKVY